MEQVTAFYDSIVGLPGIVHDVEDCWCRVFFTIFLMTQGIFASAAGDASAVETSWIL